MINLIDSSSLLKVFHAQSGLILWIKDARGVYQYVNEEYLNHFFISSVDEIIGKNDYDIAPDHIADSFLDDDQKTLKGQAILNRIELFSLKHEQLNWYVTNKFPLKSHDDKIIGTIGTTKVVDKGVKDSIIEDCMHKIMYYIKDNYKYSLSVIQMAKMCSLSVSAFERKFKKYFKLSPTEYILKFRINRVCRNLYSTNKSISEIAFDCGFSDHSYMTRQFKKIMKCSPTDFRSNYR